MGTDELAGLKADQIARKLARVRGRSLGPAGTDLVLPAAPVNALLRETFAGESGRLLRAFRGDGRGYRRRLSLIAVARRTEGGS